MPGPAVPEWVHRTAGDTGWIGDPHATAARQADPVAGGAGPGNREVPRRGESDGGTARDTNPFNHKERKDNVANKFRQQRGIRDGIVFIGVAQEKAQAFQGKKIDRQFQYTRDKTVYVNHVHPSLHINYKNFDLKQYFKEGRGCRTEGTFRNPNDFGVNKGLSDLVYLQKIGREINRRLLEVEGVSRNSGMSVRPAVAMFTSNDAGLPFPLRASLNRVDAQLDELIYQAFASQGFLNLARNLATFLKI